MARFTAKQRLQHNSARVDARYKSLNRALHNILYVPWEQSDRIILAGYPGLALVGDGSETCKDGRAGMEVVPDFQLSEQKLRDGTWVADKLHRADARQRQPVWLDLRRNASAAIHRPRYLLGLQQ